MSTHNMYIIKQENFRKTFKKTSSIQPRVNEHQCWCFSVFDTFSTICVKGVQGSYIYWLSACFHAQQAPSDETATLKGENSLPRALSPVLFVCSEERKTN